MRSIATPARCSGRGTDPWPFARTRSSSSSSRRSHRCSSRASWCWAARTASRGRTPCGFLIFGMRYYYVALTDRRLIFLNASFWTSRPKGFAWADPRESITTSDLQTDNKLWNWGKISSPTQAEPPDDLPRVLAPRAQGDGRHVGRPDRGSASGFRSGRPSGSGGCWPGPVRAAAAARAAAGSTADGGLNRPRGTLCYPGAVPGV